MAQEFTINSSAIESKINQLLPSQGGFGAGVDFSASTMVIPIVDLTETAEGSDVRLDLQTSFSHITMTSFNVSNTTTTLVNTTGYYRVFGSCNFLGASATMVGTFRINDGSTTKNITSWFIDDTLNSAVTNNFDFNVFLRAGDSLEALSSSTNINIRGCTRQIADINGNLTNP